MKRAEHGGPVVRTPRADQEPAGRPRWPRALGAAAGIVAVAALGGFWWRRSRKRRVEEGLSPLSQEWLAEHYYTSGQRGDDD